MRRWLDQIQDDGIKAGDRNKARTTGGNEWTTGFDVAPKVGGFNWSDFGKPDYKAVAFNDEAYKRLRTTKSGRKVGTVVEGTGVKQGGDWFNNSEPSISRLTGSKSSARKAACAHIAKIPYELARHIALVWKPVEKT